MTGDESDRLTLIDSEHTACLCDAGLPGYRAAMCVTADGEVEAWLVNDTVLGTPNAPHGNADQQHEQVGPLPAQWRHRVALAPWRCGQPRADGRPCRQYVSEAGRACGWHTQRASAP